MHSPYTIAVVLAGGRGTRLAPLTFRHAKPALSGGPGLRLVDYSLLNCQASGITEVGVLTEYRRRALEHHLSQCWGDGPMRVWPLPSVPGRPYRGTADAVRKNLAWMGGLGADRVLVLSGDHVYRYDYRALLEHHARHRASLTIACVTVPVAEASRYGVLEVAGGAVLSFEEKPAEPRATDGAALVSAGIYVFDFAALAHLLLSTEGEDFGHELIPAAVGQGLRVAALRFPDDLYWRDVGTVDAFYATHMDIAAGRFDPGVDARWAHPDFPGCAISPAASVSPDAELDRVVALPGAVIEGRCRLRRVLVDEDSYVPAGTVAGYPGSPFGRSPGGVTLLHRKVLTARLHHPR